MLFKVHIPKPPISDFVDSVVYSEYDPSHTVERLIPDGSINLIIELGDVPQYIHCNQDLSKKVKYSHSWISGMHQEFIAISAGNRSGLMVVRFQPIGAHKLLNIPLSVINNKVIPADCILGDSIDALRDQLMINRGLDSMFDTLDRWLISRLTNLDVQDEMIDYVVGQLENPTISVESIISNTGYSHRHFISLFKKYLGLSPKQYQRIQRFNKVLSQLEGTRNVDWARLSVACGYYDQAHFIKEFKLFSGFNPQSYLQQRGEFANYVPLD